MTILRLLLDYSYREDLAWKIVKNMGTVNGKEKAHEDDPHEPSENERSLNYLMLRKGRVFPV